MLGSFATDVIVVLVVLGFMIFIHELGHFMAAKAFRVRVLVFSLGFGKALLHLKRGDTDYRISALPFGGYVKMAGDDPSEVRQGDLGEFLSQPRWRRFIIVVMGPAMNVLLALSLLTGLYKFHFQRPAYLEQPARIGDIEPGSPAAKAGFQVGDLIVRIGNIQDPKWEDLEFKILAGVGESLPVDVLRNGKSQDLTLVPEAKGRDRTGYAGWFPYYPAVVDELEPGLPAAKAGMRPGDQIVALDGKSVLYEPNIVYEIQNLKGKEMTLTFLRQGRTTDVKLTPVYAESENGKRWRIGVRFRPDLIVKQQAWSAAFAEALSDNARISLTTFDVLGKILTRRMSARSLSGPIGIAQLSGDAYRAGFPELLFIVSSISLQLGIFNLLPIPILDGGVILLLLVESLIRRDLSIQVKERFVQVGIVFLLFLAVFVMYNDVVKTLNPY